MQVSGACPIRGMVSSLELPVGEARNGPQQGAESGEGREGT